jgi:dihydropteroate synthase
LSLVVVPHKVQGELVMLRAGDSGSRIETEQIDETSASLETVLDRWRASGHPAVRALERCLDVSHRRFVWEFANVSFDLSSRILVMGVVNVTPDSFYDGGMHFDPRRAVEAGLSMAAEGADVVDIGGESTRPGAEEVTVSEELRRVVPVVKELSDAGVRVSIDTRHPRVAEEALHAGASVVNDVTGFCDPAMVGLVAGSKAGAVVMHMQGAPKTMQQDPTYQWVTGEVALFLAGSLDRLGAAGTGEERIVVDPGIGFGKTLDHNVELIKALDVLVCLGRPILVGLSRKSFIGQIANLPPRHRLEGSLAAATVAVLNGARIVRVHDVLSTVRAMRVVERLL